MPPGASKMEQFKATHAANQIRDEDHAGSATVEILSEFIRSKFVPNAILLILQSFIVNSFDILGEQCGDNCNQFFEALGISSDDVSEESTVDDAESENAANREVKLYKISDASGSLEITEVSGMPLTQDMLSAEVILEMYFYSRWKLIINTSFLITNTVFIIYYISK